MVFRFKQSLNLFLTRRLLEIFSVIMSFIENEYLLPFSSSILALESLGQYITSLRKPSQPDEMICGQNIVETWLQRDLFQSPQRISAASCSLEQETRRKYPVRLSCSRPCLHPRRFSRMVFGRTVSGSRMAQEGLQSAKADRNNFPSHSFFGYELDVITQSANTFTSTLAQMANSRVRSLEGVYLNASSEFFRVGLGVSSSMIVT